MTVYAIIQARMGSSRLPGKVMMDIIGKPAIWHLVNQLNYSKSIDGIILATTEQRLDDPIYEYAIKQKWNVYRGSEDDVLDRYYKAAFSNGCTNSDAIVRCTGDDILADPEIVDQLMELYMGNIPEVKHVSNNRIATFPYGSDVEVFSFDALEQAWREAKLPAEREHVTPYIRNHPEYFPFLDIKYHKDLSHIYLSIDTHENLEFNRKLFHKLYENNVPPFHLKDILKCINKYGITQSE